ncbi:aldo/keto reductase [Pedobacter antarcticus]|uniref:aldo/keto reductase n=1 Tax=Pedobacter antarcticus TaxID=34086 RepID=UPI002931AE67|nr:aldo/keto reductase [Pedobacter antarcticus]
MEVNNQSEMQYKTLGNTGLLVSRFCLGTMTFHGGSARFQVMGQVDQNGVDELVSTSIESGINFFDTADVYSEGESERSLGQSFKNLNVARKDVIIATKAYSRIGKGVNDIGASRSHILDAVDGSLKRLGTDYIDLYQIHGNDSVTPIEETLRALDDLVRSGKVRYIGVSNWQAWKIAKALTISGLKNYEKFSTVQAYYSIAGRDLEREIVPLLQQEKTGLMVWSPLAGGLLSGKFSRNNQKPEGSRRSSMDLPLVDKERAWNILEAIEPMTQKYNCSSAQISLSWLLSKPVVTSVIIGAKKTEQLKDNIAAIGLKLEEEDLNILNEVSKLPAEYPNWIIEFQDKERLGSFQRLQY